MTLHWWMHWFWVTVQFFVILGNPVPSSTVEPQSQVQVHQDSKPASEIPSVEGEVVYAVNPSRQSARVAKAIGLYPATNTAVIHERQGTTTVAGEMEGASTVEIVGGNSTSVAEDSHESINSTERVDVSKVSVSSRPENMERVRGVKKESKITWILTTNKTGRSKYDQEDKVQEGASRGRNTSSTEEVEDLTVLPLQEEISRVRLILNRTKPSASLVSSSSLSASGDTLGSAAIRTFNRSDDDVEIDEELVEPSQSFATAASILQVGASESTRLSRARSAFPKDFQRDQVQGEDHLADYNESSSAEEAQIGGSSSSHSAVDIAAITGSCLATVVILSTMGSLGFIMYRRRYLNPPQTLNSDKCSNPDSSGYIDDSTIRDNSEEMYSLDNDSFLNSLEAMTIQNYWTDSVKHTKL